MGIGMGRGMANPRKGNYVINQYQQTDRKRTDTNTYRGSLQSKIYENQTNYALKYF